MLLILPSSSWHGCDCGATGASPLALDMQLGPVCKVVLACCTVAFQGRRVLVSHLAGRLWKAILQILKQSLGRVRRQESDIGIADDRSRQVCASAHDFKRVRRLRATVRAGRHAEHRESMRYWHIHSGNEPLSDGSYVY